jgi:hypothetical protein
MPWDTFFVDLLSALPCRTSPHTKFVQLKLHTMPKCGSEAVFSSVFFFFKARQFDCFGAGNSRLIA